MNVISDKERIDEALELIWVLQEDGHSELARFTKSSDDADINQVIELLINDELVNVSDNMIILTR